MYVSGAYLCQGKVTVHDLYVCHVVGNVCKRVQCTVFKNLSPVLTQV